MDYKHFAPLRGRGLGGRVLSGVFYSRYIQHLAQLSPALCNAPISVAHEYLNNYTLQMRTRVIVPNFSSQYSKGIHINAIHSRRLLRGKKRGDDG